MVDKRFPNWDIDVEEGKIYSLRLKRNIGSVSKDGYLLVQPPKGYKHWYIHQYIWMVANQADIPKGYDVHHMDGNTLNNSIYNLELVEHSTHLSEHKKGNKNSLGKYHTDEAKMKMSKAKKGTQLNRKDLSKQVAQYTLDGELVKVWESANECGRNGFIQSGVSACCRGELKKYKGYIWKYLNEERDVA